jgi:ubiquinone biosynthesis protein UbiJ
MEEASGSDRIADAVAGDGAKVLRPYIGDEAAKAWAEQTAKTLRETAGLRQGIASYNKGRGDMLTRLRGELKTIPDREARRQFDNVIQRVARATQITGAD